MGLDIFVYATKAQIKPSKLDTLFLDEESWNRAFDNGEIIQVGKKLRSHWLLHRYMLRSYLECDGGEGTLNCDLYPINHFVEPVLTLSKSRQYDAFSPDEGDEISFLDQRLSEVEQLFTECQKYADQGYTIVYYAWWQSN